jgi:S-DNA-T family DNA segregation ATPase FtsK/SpoIIIE
MAKKTNRPSDTRTNTKDVKQKSDNPESQPLFSKNRIRLGSGLFLVLISFIFLVSFTSFLFTGNYDQNILGTGISELGESEIQNWLGKFGALLSNKFIADWFGISAFIFVPIIFRWGIKLLFKYTLLPAKDVFKYSIFTLIWLPPTLSYFITADSLLFMGGGIGLSINWYLQMFLGNIGTFLVLGFSLLAFVLINFDISLDVWLEKLFPKVNEESENTVDPIQDEPETGIDDPVLQYLHSDDFAPKEFVSELDEEEDELDMNLDESEENAHDFISLSLEETTEEKAASEEEFVPKDDELELQTVVGEEEHLLDEKELNDLAKKFGEYDPTLELSRFQKPSLDLLKDFGEKSIEIDRAELEANKNRIINTLKNYNIEISQISAVIGPTVTLYEIVPAPGVRISKIKNLEDDIALSLSALGIRIIAPIPGKGTIGIEVPNKKSEVVSMKAMLASEKFQNSDMILPVALGKTISNESYIADLAKMPHLLMAGATGQGKSVGLNAILVSLLYKLHPSQLKFVLVDPKKVELTLYNKIERHYLAKLPNTDEAIITDTHKVVATLNSLCIEMDQRYELLKEAMTRNIKEYNEKFVARKLNPENGHRYLPYIVLVIDEFADLIMTAGKEVETPIARLAQLARAIGIHLIVATQRPSVNVITGIIKANFPARLAFRVTSKIDSRTILDSGGADQLIGRGDLLFSPGNEIIRLQCPFVDTPEVERICEFIGEQQGYADAFLLPEYVGEASTNQGSMEDEDRDALFEEAALIVVQHQQGSASLLQRRLKLGYNRAGRIVDQLEAAGIIGPFSGSKARDVLISDEISLEQKLRGME